ncbi:hypothetical protein V8C42DRAFT_298541 [Trichoderma barbatum]
MEHPGRVTARRGLDMPGRLRRGNYPVWRAILLSVLSQAHPPVRDGTRHCTSICTRYSMPGAALCTLRRLTSTTVASTVRRRDAKRQLLALHPLANPVPYQEPMPWPLQCTHERAELPVDLFSGRGSHMRRRIESRARSVLSLLCRTAAKLQEQGTVAWLLMLMAIRISGTRCLTLVCPKAD